MLAERVETCEGNNPAPLILPVVLAVVLAVVPAWRALLGVVCLFSACCLLVLRLFSASSVRAASQTGGSEERCGWCFENVLGNLVFGSACDLLEFCAGLRRVHAHVDAGPA